MRAGLRPAAPLPRCAAGTPSHRAAHGQSVGIEIEGLRVVHARTVPLADVTWGRLAAAVGMLLATVALVLLAGVDDAGRLVFP